MNHATVNEYSESWLRKGFPWVYPQEITSKRPPIGSMVALRGPKGQSLGRGIASDSFVAIRRFREDDGEIDSTFLAGVLDRCAALRQAVVPPQTDGYRLCNAENDGLPGIRIDWWRCYAVITLDCPSLMQLVEPIVEWLVADRAPRGVVVCHRPDSRSGTGAQADPSSLAYGHPPRGPVRVLECGTSFDVWPLEGPDVGLYADMRDTRQWLANTWSGTQVLNTFAYTGAFSVSAARNGASEVVSVDASALVLERAEGNFAANGLTEFPHEVLVSDVFKALDRFRRTGRTFDRVIVDPPAFSHGAGLFSAKRDYPRLVAAAARVLVDGGWLIAASNQGELSPKAFDGLLTDGLRKAERVGQVLYAGSQSGDFPAATTFPEGRYLKVRVIRVAAADWEVTNSPRRQGHP